jgi:uncharacterized membrane protein YccC
MACQAAIAILLTELIYLNFHIRHGYWATLTAMALTTQTWGESIIRSLERISMTILGGVIGTVLYFLLPNNNSLVLIILLVFIFLNLYLVQINQMLAIFALTGFVVFLFAMIGEWSWALLQERILDTFLGAVVALLVSCFFLPVKSNILSLFAEHLAQLQDALAVVYSDGPAINSSALSHTITADMQMIRVKARLKRYEVLFHQMSLNEFSLLMNYTAFCTQCVVGLLDSYHLLASTLSPEEMGRIQDRKSVV